MLEKIKETLKDWILAHEKLYWFIIFGLAFTGFLLVTMFGLAKAVRAEAAETTDGVYYPQLLKEVELGEYETKVLEICNTYPYVAVSQNANNVYKIFFFSETDSKVFNGGYTSIPFMTMPCSALVQIEKLKVVYANQYSQMHIRNPLSADASDMFLVGTNFPIAYKDSEKNNSFYTNFVDAQPCDNLVHPLEYREIVYSGSAPYVSFERLDIDNKLNQGISTLGVDGNLYSEYFAQSTWRYFGILKNVSDDDVSYKLNLKFEIELPTIDYVQGLYDEFGYNYTSDRVILKRNTELIKYWYKDVDADSRIFVVERSFDITPDENGRFSYSLSFVEWEYLLRAFSSELVAEFQEYSASWRAALLSFMHVKAITSEVVTTRSDCEIYGGFTSNVFQRGVYDTCVDVYTNVDKNFISSDLLDKWISEDIRTAEREYQKELEDKINSLESQLGDLTNIQNGFGGSLETTNLWASFTNLVQGLASFAPAIAALSSLAGICLGFLPLQMAGVIASTLLAICIIALINSIKG